MNSFRSGQGFLYQSMEMMKRVFTFTQVVGVNNVNTLVETRARVGGSVLFISQSRGSPGTPAAIAETLRNGSGPAAFVLASADLNISVGVMAANRLYQLNVPVIEIALSQFAQIVNGSNIQVGEGD